MNLVWNILARDDAAAAPYGSTLVAVNATIFHVVKGLMGARPRLLCREREHRGCEAAVAVLVLGCPHTDGWVGPLSSWVHMSIGGPPRGG